MFMFIHDDSTENVQAFGRCTVLTCTHPYSPVLTPSPDLQRFVRTVWAVCCGGCMLMHVFVNCLATFQRCAAVRSSRMRVVSPAPTTPTTTSPTRSVCGRSRSPRDTPSRYTSTPSRYVTSYILSGLRKDPVSHFSVYSRNMFYMYSRNALNVVKSYCIV